VGAKPIDQEAEALAVMPLRWTRAALADIGRLHAFLADVNPAAAAKVVQSLTQGAGRLQDNPRLGMRLNEFDPREVRRIVVGQYEIRYELDAKNIHILRLWHTREDR
jgi:plasmid stabilization system protein ParE